MRTPHRLFVESVAITASVVLLATGCSIAIGTPGSGLRQIEARLDRLESQSPAATPPQGVTAPGAQSSTQRLRAMAERIMVLEEENRRLSQEIGKLRTALAEEPVTNGETAPELQ